MEKSSKDRQLSRLVQVGDFLMETSYVRVTDVCRQRSIPAGVITVEDIRSGLRYDVRGPELIDVYACSDHPDRDEYVTRTELATRLVESGGRPFTVVFRKASGDPRTLRGYLDSTEHLLGRSLVYDIDVKDDSPLRLVDHRTITALVLGNVRFLVK